MSENTEEKSNGLTEIAYNLEKDSVVRVLNADGQGLDEDEKLLKTLGYQPKLHRTYEFFENFASSFSCCDFMANIRGSFYVGLLTGGPSAYWITYCIAIPLSLVSASSIAEVCSALPTAGSVYFWASAAGGRKYGRLIGFLVAWWAVVAWTSFVAVSCHSTSKFIFGELPVFKSKFSVSSTDVKFRAVQWAVGEGLLLISVLINSVPPKWFRYVFRASVFVILLDFLLNLIWLPIATSKKYGFRDQEFMMSTNYGIGKVNHGWSWCLTFFCTARILVGYDAAGHVAEETKNASQTAARGMFYSALSNSILSCCIMIVFLYCLPPSQILYPLMKTNEQQPFVSFYALVLGKRAHVFMNVVGIIGTILDTTLSIVASSRLVFAVARDGVLPFSQWLSKVDGYGQPKNAIYFIYFVAAALLCSNLPSSVAFTSLMSAAAVPTILSYATIAFGRLFLSKDKFPTSKWSLGFLSKPFLVITFLWNLFTAVILFSPKAYPVTAKNFNYAPVIFGAITIFGLISWMLIPAVKWNTFHEPKDDDDRSSLQNKI
ncbi:hypothetical protein SPOG_03511 [Schizosaccharomyces cryophilus OY26]|uniref:Thiamine transporter thi9 n=1 Tax=Schizosaccharomyces cryophilus (strain OY26 / ATCC MYA-4695 / CBS 11777 / NBRC 106824 / NRRL Y48691) TaxID=653667 RepID=S9WZA0_SCHCR|nr:uncharacterized protein SPOG_03511 [Schizosaccharomyces cryophilus OY26]EPY50042.1 hypothetical protein SPOG_03511 [Schizosaccharomyces cryophilus OY26]